MARKKKPDNVVALPRRDWKGDFIRSSLRANFSLQLTQPMLEYLSSVADGVEWDRSLYFQDGGLARPDSFLVTARALEKRGLITWGSKDRTPKIDWSNEDEVRRHVYEQSFWLLTPAGEAVVELLKVTGLFVEADAAISKKVRSHTKRGE